MKKIAIHTGFVVVLLSALNTVCFSQDTSVETSIVNSQIQQLVDDLLINVPDNDLVLQCCHSKPQKGEQKLVIWVKQPQFL
jgi:hypothetical protein